ncbi:hypothetical protein JTB14_029140 [Gonioctena quinquepunctata]|nr:hypothetical protein JTB14_029140 [Gonioctena quinquepunctata]
MRGPSTQKRLLYGVRSIGDSKRSACVEECAAGREIQKHAHFFPKEVVIEDYLGLQNGLLRRLCVIVGTPPIDLIVIERERLNDLKGQFKQREKHTTIRQ